MPIKQESRLLALKTALAEDKVGVKSASVEEQISRLFRIELELSSEDANIKLDDILGQSAALRLSVGQSKTRYFHGVISRLIQVGNEGGYAQYRATMVPWLWLLTRTSDCRIFQAKTIPTIIEDVFKAHGFADYKLSLSGDYQPRDYCVQYRETDFNFVCRLMEQEGIYFFFTHEESKHVMVIADSISAHAPFEGYAEVPFYPIEKAAAGREAVSRWSVQKELQPVACALSDFDFTKPKTSLLSSANVSRPYGQARFEIFDYPGEYEETSEGERLSDVRLQEFQTQYEVGQGQGTARGICAGATFKLKNHARADQNQEYLVTSVQLRAEAGEYASGGDQTGDFFSCSFSTIPKTQQYRPLRVTPKPIVQGPQTAFVAGTSGEEILTDKYGRVKVQFHWDRYGKGDENSSCWIRVATESAGKKWGAIRLPRIGQEVIVEFLEGDPDRPIITGRVYNAEAMPPYDLPGKQTVSTLKSNSSKGGAGFNEIRFEDKKGEEQIFVHGEKNVDVRVKNDTYEWVGNDRHLIVKKDQVETVENNREETVKADHKEKIGKDRHLKVVGKEAKGVDGSLSLTVKGDVIEVFKANHSEQTTNDYYLKADNVVIEGQTNITLKVGGTTIAMAADGIEIKTSGTVKIEAGATMDLKATAPLKMESSATAELKSPATTVKGDGMLTLKGGMVMIN